MRKLIGNALRMKILTRDGFKCTYCGAGVKEEAVLQVDHILPVSKGGTNDEFNLTTSCRNCNMGKFNKEISELEGMRISSAKKELENEIDIQKSKKDLEETAYLLIKTKKENMYSPEFFAYKRYIEECGYSIEQKHYKRIESIIKKYGLEYVIEITECIKGGGKVSPGYIEGIIFNKELHKEYGVGYDNYLIFKRDVLDSLYLKFPLDKYTISFLCRMFADGFKNEFEVFYIKEIVKLLKRKGKYKEIPMFIRFIGENIRGSKKYYLKCILLYYLKELHNLSDDYVEDVFFNKKCLQIKKDKITEKEKWFRDLNMLEGLSVDGDNFLLFFDINV